MLASIRKHGQVLADLNAACSCRDRLELAPHGFGVCHCPDAALALGRDCEADKPLILAKLIGHVTTQPPADAQVV